MLQPKLISSKPKLDIPVSYLTETETKQKSCFIDNNRVDTVKTAKIIADKKQKD